MSELRPRTVAIDLAARAAILLVLAGGLTWVAGSDADVVATIAATVILVAILLLGVPLTWLGAVARTQGARGAGWVTAQGAVLLVAGMVAPVIAFPQPLIHTAGVVWGLAAALAVSGLLEIAGRVARGVSWSSGVAQLVGAAALAVAIWMREDTRMVAMIGPTGVVVAVVGLALAWCSVSAAVK